MYNPQYQLRVGYDARAIGRFTSGSRPRTDGQPSAEIAAKRSFAGRVVVVSARQDKRFAANMLSTRQRPPCRARSDPALNHLACVSGPCSSALRQARTGVAHATLSFTSANGKDSRRKSLADVVVRGYRTQRDDCHEVRTHRACSRPLRNQTRRADGRQFRVVAIMLTSWSLRGAQTSPDTGRITGMLTLQECIDLSGLEVEVIEAIARHERIPEIVAAELGNHLLATGTDGTHG